MTTCLINIKNLPFDVWALNGGLVFLISVLLTGILIPKILLISFRRRLFDVPDARKIHQGTVPRLGGIAFMPSIILALSSVTALDLVLLERAGDEVVGISFGADVVPLCFGMCALMLMYLVGIADDLIGVKYRAKFVVQIIAALLLVSSGMVIDNLHGFLGLHELSSGLSVPLTVVVIVLIINAVNLIDGIDGLASGLSTIACGFYVAVCYSLHAYTYAMIGLAMMGTLIPFYFYNVFGSAKMGRKIFMGDTGALTTGLVLSFLAIKMLHLDYEDTDGAVSPAVLAFSPLVVPCLDVVRVFFHRLSRGHSPFQPGRTHIHHKFLAVGMRQRYAMISILILSAAYIALNVMISPALSIGWILLVDLLIWVGGNIWLTKAIRERQARMPETRNLYD